MSQETKEQIPASVRKVLSRWGSKGGKAGSREDKSKAGKIGHAAMIAKLAEKQAAEPDPAPVPVPEGPCCAHDSDNAQPEPAADTPADIKTDI